MGLAECKVLCVMCDVTADLVVFSVQEIASLEDVERPKKRKSPVLFGDSITHLDIFYGGCQVQDVFQRTVQRSLGIGPVTYWRAVVQMAVSGL